MHSEFGNPIDERGKRGKGRHKKRHGGRKAKR